MINFFSSCFCKINYKTKSNFFYRLLQRCFIDMENMLDLMKEEQEIVDDADAKSIDIQNGTIEFRNVSFRYHSIGSHLSCVIILKLWYLFSYIAGKEVLKNVSFVVPGGKSVALVWFHSFKILIIYFYHNISRAFMS